MEYEYQALVWADLGSSEKNELNKLFSQGWEYVHGFSQSVSSSGNGYSDRDGNYLIILKRKKDYANPQING